MLANHLDYGGISVYILNLCRAWRKRTDIKVYVGSSGGDLEEELKSLGAGHIRLPLTTKCEVSLKVFLSFFKLAKKVRRLGIDVIHANTRVTQVLAILLSRSSGIPVVSTCHGYFKRRASRRAFPCWGEKVIAISEQVKEHLIKDFQVEPGRIELIYNGVDLEEFHPYDKTEIEKEKKRFGLDPQKKIIGHIGRLSSVKGQKFLVLAAEALAHKRGDVQFLIIGDGEEEGPLRDLIVRKGLEGVVKVCNSVRNTSISLAVMDVFAMPSLQEGLGISILEAQAQGIPVVASRVGGIPSIVEDGKTGLTFEVGDVVSLVSAIERFLEDKAFRDLAVRSAKAQAQERFSLKEMADRTTELYKAVI